MNVNELRLHPDADLIPPMTEAEYDALYADVIERGIQVPLDVTSDGMVLDGRHRLGVARALGLAEVPTREVDIPEGQWRDYMVRAAVLRRHLTLAQKKALNALLREEVVETIEREPEPVRIGRGQTQRAAALGVDRDTVKRWDKESEGVGTPPAPTHYRRTADDSIQPLHPDRKLAEQMGPRSRKGRTSPPPRHAPVWMRFLTQWCKKVLPEDRKYLVEIIEKAQQALALLDEEGRR